MSLNFLYKWRNRLFISLPGLIGMATLITFRVCDIIDRFILAYGMLACGLWMLFWLAMYWFVLPYTNENNL